MHCLYKLVTSSMWTLSCLWWCSWYESILSQVYTRYGKCYTFNGNKTTSRKSKQGGMGNGLEIMLDIQQDEYLPIWRETSKPQNYLFIVTPPYSRRYPCCRLNQIQPPIHFSGSHTVNNAFFDCFAEPENVICKREFLKKIHHLRVLLAL